jgi:DNA polymerase-3 subunit beta
MEIIIESQLLAKNLNVLKRVIATSSPMPILSCFLFRVVEKKLTVVASDLDITLEIQLEAQCSTDGSFAVSSDIFMEMIKALPDQAVTLKFSEKQLEIESLSGNYNMAVDNAQEFPKTPKFEETTKTSIAAHVLNKAFTKTMFATGTDDLRPMLTGVCLDFKKESLVFVATDANKLVKYIRTDMKSENEMQLIIPKKPISVLISALSGKDSDVSIGFNGTNVSFVFEDTVMMCRLIDAKYPNYEAVIPKENPNTLIISRTDLLGSLKRISIFANRMTHQVIIDKKGNLLTILSEDKDYNSKGTESLTCVGDGDDLKIGFNARFLSEMLSNLSSEKIKIEMSAPNRAGIITQVGSDDSDESITMLVMPVMITA